MRSSTAFRFARRAAVVCLATAGVAAFGGQPANAGPASASGSTTAAATIRSYGFDCNGSQVRRCAWFNVDHTNNRVRAYSYIVDARGGRNYSVATNYVQLQAWNGRSWVNLGRNADGDGWHATSDGAAGRLLGCRNGGSYVLRSVAHFQWRGNPNGASWKWSKIARVRC
jgi:hypothetical protein